MRIFHRLPLNVLLTLALIFPTVSLAMNAAVVLQYHHVSDNTPVSTSIAPEQFERHLDYLEKHHFQVWSFERIVSALQKGTPLPDRCVALTFDDAYISVYTEAFPRLKRRHWPFTVFVATEGIENGFDSFMSWDQIREMAPHQVTFASHSHSHPYMVRKRKGETEGDWRIRMISEIRVSRSLLTENRLEKSDLFAYPYGEYNLDLKRIVESENLVGVGQHSGGVWSGSDFLALPRFPMSGSYAEMNDFILKVNTLPLPVKTMSPEDPVVHVGQNPPRLDLTLEAGPYDPQSLACFASGQGKIPVTWLSHNDIHFQTSAHHPLATGRNRYNCTARHLTENRFYWFSQQWIRLP